MRRSLLGPSVLAFFLLTGPVPSRGFVKEACQSMKELSLSFIPSALKPKDSARRNTIEFARILLTDQFLSREFAKNPYLAAYIYFKHLAQTPGIQEGLAGTPAEKSTMAKIATEYFILAQKELGKSALQEDMAILDGVIEKALKNSDQAQYILGRFDGVDQNLDVDGMRKVTNTKWRLTKDRFKAMTHQLAALPKTLKRIKDLVDQELAAEKLDGLLWSHWGFHNENQRLGYRMRPWDKVPLSEIGPRQVEHFTPEEFANIARAAMEIEIPIQGYSFQSGNGLRTILPSLSRFMGLHAEEHNFRLENGRDYCHGGWCSEENRHSGALARVSKALTGRDPDKSNPNQVASVPVTDDGALYHLDSRGSTEWNASSGYFVLGGHASGPLLAFVKNFLRDEIKHATIIGGARKYLLGDRPNNRLWAHIKKALNELKEQGGERAGGNFITNPVTIIEAVFTHVWVEYRMRQYISTLPLRTLQEVFDFEKELPKFDALPVDPALLSQYQADVERNSILRKALSRWPEDQRRRALEQNSFEAKYGSEIEQAILNSFGGFVGAEIPGSPQDQMIRQKIDTFALESVNPSLIRQVLIDRLRDYQIRNNSFSKQLTQIAVSAH
ncbi:MAG: hypothetical protein IT289_07520 [Oligoflexia bacterium]|nr:hypothetical protein [Oligoflexia bacterium]